MADKLIKSIQVDSTTIPHEIAAKYIQDGDGNEKDWAAIKDLIAKDSTSLVPLTTLPEATAANYEKYKHDIILIPEAGALDGTKVEYVILDKGASESPRYYWEQIGTTKTDLKGYAKTGTYTSSEPSTNTTGTPSVENVTGSGTYSKSKSATESKGSDTNDNTGPTSGGTVDFTNAIFTGTSVNLIKPNNGTVKLDKHVIASHTHSIGSGSTSIYQITGVGSVPTREEFTYVSGTKATGAFTNVVTGYGSFDGGSYTQGAKAQFTQGAKADLKYTARANVMCSPTVTNSILSWGLTSADDITAWSANGTDTFTPNGTDSFTPASLGTASTASVILSTGLTTSSAYQITGVGSVPSRESLTVVTSVDDSTGSGGAVTLTHAQAQTTATLYDNLSVTVNTSTYAYTPAGGITGTQILTAHSHTYVKLPAHTHEIKFDDATVEVTVSLGSHTHTMGNHTHSVTLTNSD